MSKELFFSSPTHETKVAVLEDDSLVEVFYQRDTDVGLVGGIYKGRVSRVLPGMQSAFVDIGLERDAFLYVSDFFEDSDEYDRVVAEAETRVSKLTATEAGLARAEPAPEAATAVADPLLPAPAVEPASETAGAGTPEVSERSSTAVQPASATTGGPAPSHMAQSGSPAVSSGAQTQQPSRWQESRGRRRRRGRGFERRPELREHRPPEPASPSGGLELLPGESLAKYAHLTAEGVTGLRADAADAAPLAQDVPGPALPIHEAAEPEERKSDDPTGQFSSSGALVEVTERLASTASSGARSEDRLEHELLSGNLRLAPLPVEPDAPAHHLVSQAPGEEPSKIGAAVRPAVDEALDSNQGAEAEEFESSAEVSESSTGVEEASERGGRLAEVEAVSEEEVEEEGAAGDSFEPVLADAEGGASPAPAGDISGETGDRSYTLRDSNQRPRFAPRRGRRGRGRFGRRGGPGQRPEGLPRRQDHSRGGNEQSVQINEVLKEGQEILVQIAKEPLGTKGARITSHIALPGRYLVYMPTIHHTGVSRKIASEEERLRLRNIILEHRGALTGGIIVRTAAAGRSEEELKADIDFLAKLWNEIRTRSERSKAPAMIHRDLTLVERILRDFLSPDFKSVRVDNEMEYENVLDFVHRFQPSLVGHVKLYTKETPMFEEFGIQAEIDKALKPKVWLKSGGYIVINQTEALVAIDVNTGKYVGKTNRLEDTIVKTNIDAVKEIVRQIRLRDLGGIIVIDFIDMDDRRNRMKVVQALEEALRSDRAPTKILSFNEFGLVALTRKRVKQSLERTLSEQCPYCTGSGWIKSVTTVCYEILEEAKKMAHEMEGKLLTLRVNPEVARALKSREGVLALELESLTGKDVVIKGDPTVHQERFEIF